jgi:hypothetical protein
MGYSTSEDQIASWPQCLRVMAKRRETPTQQREDIEAMLAALQQFSGWCHAEIGRREPG